MRAFAGIASIRLIFLGFALACASPPPVPPQPDPAGQGFASERAWQHLSALTAIGPRVAGSEGAEQARQYIRDQLSKLDIRVEEHVSEIPLPPDYQATVPATNLIAVIPGASPDLVVLAAPYDSMPVEGARFVGANDGASGAAVLLEIAPALVESPLPYTTWIAFFDAEAPRETGDPRQPRVSLLGSTTFALNLAQLDLIRHIRLLVVMNRVCDSDLRIARDLHSHRLYREEFFKAAVRTGNTRAFPQDQAFESATASHRSFTPYGLRRVVALTGTTLDPPQDETEASGEGGAEDKPALDAEEIVEPPAPAPAPAADVDEDDLEGCSRESLEAVGEVTLEALRAIGTRLAKVDRFSESPLAALEEPVPVPQGTAAEGDDAAEEPAEGEVPDEESPGDEATGEAASPEEDTPEAAVSPPEPATPTQQPVAETDPWAQEAGTASQEPETGDCDGRPCEWESLPE